MELFLTLLVAAAVFGVCYAVDRLFTKSFRSRAQHRSGLAVRASKRYGIFGVGLSVLGVMAICGGIPEDFALMVGGVLVLLMGLGLAVYYLSFGIFYDGESLLYCRSGKKSVTYLYRQIVGQKLYQIQGGTVVIELHMEDGSALSLQSTMDGVYPFLDTAFAGWCLQLGRDPQSCTFHDPANSLWFPSVTGEEG